MTARVVLALTATYATFLLFAQFGFLAQVRTDLAGAADVRAVMAWMGAGGLAASLVAATLLGRLAAGRLLRPGFAAAGIVALLSLACHGTVTLRLAAGLIGASLGLLTVTLAASLHSMVTGAGAGLTVGLGTGLAYLLSNLPPLFTGPPSLRATVPAALCGLALLAPPRVLPAPPAPDGLAPALGRLSLARALPAFLALVWLDSAAFVVLGVVPALRVSSWGSDLRILGQGIVHLGAAILAGWLLDRGRGPALLAATFALFAVALRLVGGTGPLAGLGGPLYAAGISLYSVALVVYPAATPGEGALAPRWRAGLLFGLAGWCGSALGVGMAQDLGRVPPWFLVAVGAVLVLTVAAPSAPRMLAAGRGLAPTVAMGGLGLLATLGPAGSTAPASIPDGNPSVARGRGVYAAEGCIHCHSQYVRRGTRDERWWGPYRSPDRPDGPAPIGNRRLGPDLTNVGARRSALWQELHLRNPRAVSPGSRMPAYAHLFEDGSGRGADLVAYLGSLGSTRDAGPHPVPVRLQVAPSPARGHRLFGEYCAGCHGPEGAGDGPLAGRIGDPDLDLRRVSVSPARTGGSPEAALATVIRDGVPGSAMAGHEYLSDRDLADLAGYVLALAPRPETPRWRVARSRPP